MKKYLVAAIMSGLASLHPILASAEEQEQPKDEVLELIGEIANCAITSQHININSTSSTFLRIEKNGKETALFPLVGVRELVVIRCQGSGLGVSPRNESLGEGMQIRVIARKNDGRSVFSVSYTIPAETKHSAVKQNAELPTLYSRKDMAGDDLTQLGNLILTVEEKKGEQGSAGQPATRPELK